MTNYRIEHRTTYTYDSDVTGSYGLLHLRPRDLAWQSCLANEIAIDPEPADLFRHIDLYGNTKGYFHVIKPHTRLAVTSISSMVDIGVNELDPEALAMPWNGRSLGRDDDGEAWEAMDFTFPSPYVEVASGNRGLRSPVLPGRAPYRRSRGRADAPHSPRLHVPIRLDHAEHEDFRAARERTGVCQDFPHFMVSSLRSLGLAGRYVSGYLATRPAPGKPRLIGDAASHAWAGCWIPDAGWLYLDPTNDRFVDDCMPLWHGVATTATCHRSRA